MYNGTDSLEYSPEPPGQWDPIKKWAREDFSSGTSSESGGTTARVALEAWFLWAPTFADLRQALRSVLCQGI